MLWFYSCLTSLIVKLHISNWSGVEFCWSHLNPRLLYTDTMPPINSDNIKVTNVEAPVYTGMILVFFLLTLFLCAKKKGNTSTLTLVQRVFVLQRTQKKLLTTRKTRRLNPLNQMKLVSNTREFLYFLLYFPIFSITIFRQKNLERR